MRLTVVQQTLVNDGSEPVDGTPNEQISHLFERILPHRPDLLLLNGCKGWGDNGHRLLVRAKREFDLLATPLGESYSGHRTVILYRPATLGDWVAFDSSLSGQTYHGYCYAAFNVGLVQPLGIVSFSLQPYSPQTAQAEVGIIASRGFQCGRFAIAAGAGVYPPAHQEHGEPAWAAMRPHEVGTHRLLPSDPTQDETRANRHVAREYLSRGYVDAGWYTADRLATSSVLANTSRFGRTDWALVTTPLAPMVTSYQTLWEPPNTLAHGAVLVTLDTNLGEIADHAPVQTALTNSPPR